MNLITYLRTTLSNDTNMSKTIEQMLKELSSENGESVKAEALKEIEDGLRVKAQILAEGADFIEEAMLEAESEGK